MQGDLFWAKKKFSLFYCWETRDDPNSITTDRAYPNGEPAPAVVMKLLVLCIVI